VQLSKESRKSRYRKSCLWRDKMKTNATELASVESEIRAALPANSNEMPQVT
jgi:hypothetical protein